jgi:cytochrome c-type protein NapB
MRRRFYCLLLLSFVSGILAESLNSADPKEESPPRRLFFGSPTAVPHEVGGAMGECLSCHGEEGTGAPLTPHPTMLHCRQCHVPAGEVTGEFRANHFVGLKRPKTAPRAHSKAPSIMPHPVLLHEKCLACHAPKAREDVVGTTHPERQHCRQCHIAQASNPPRFSGAH